MNRRPWWPPALVGAGILLSYVVTIGRAPVPWNDEIWDASAVLSLVHGGNGVPTALPAGTWDSFPRFYGPAYFRLTTIIARAGGVTPTTIRLASLLGAILIAAAAGWLAWTTSRRAAWAWLAFAIVAAAPDLGAIATNGRVDALAIGAEIAGLAALVACASGPTGRSLGLSFLAGAAWAVALLSSGRVVPFFGALALTVPAVALVPAPDRRRVLLAAAVAGAIGGGTFVRWTIQAGYGPIGRVLFLRNATRQDWFNGVTAGGHRTWGLYLRPGIMLAGTIALAVAAGAARLVPGTLARLARLAWAAAALTLAISLSVGNNVLYTSSYFTIPLLATSLAVVPLVAGTARRRVAFVATGLVGAVFLAVALGKTLETVQSWPALDPRPLEAFVAREVPAGSLVFGPDHFYFYAVEASGSSYRAASLTPFPGPEIGVATARSVLEGTAGARRYLLWPAGAALPETFACVGGEPAATFEPRRRTGLLGRFVDLYTHQDGLPASRLFEVPETC